MSFVSKSFLWIEAMSFLYDTREFKCLHDYIGDDDMWSEVRGGWMPDSFILYMFTSFYLKLSNIRYLWCTSIRF